MELNSDSLLVKWTYLFRAAKYSCDNNGVAVYSKAPASTTLCRFFWRAFVFMPLAALVLTTVVVTLLVTLCRGIYYHPLYVLGITLGVIVLTGIVIMIVQVIEKGIPISIPNKFKKSTFVQGFKAIKSKVCPIVYIK